MKASPFIVTYIIPTFGKYALTVFDFGATTSKLEIGNYTYYIRLWDVCTDFSRCLFTKNVSRLCKIEIKGRVLEVELI